MYSPAGKLLDTLGTAPGMAGVIRSSGESLEILRPLVAPTTTYAIGGSMLWIETGESRRLDFLDLDNRVDGVITWNGPDLSMTPAYRQAIIDEAVESVPEESRTMYRASMERRPVPETIPATRRVTSDHEGRGWLELAPPPGGDGPRTWIIFNLEGAPEARVELPPNMSLRSVLDDAVLVVERDDFDVEHVRTYRFSGA